MFDDVYRTLDGYEVTSKDRMRMERLVEVAQSKSAHTALSKAERDAVKIETPQKAAARSFLLERAGLPGLAAPFRRRLVFLRAQGLT